MALDDYFLYLLVSAGYIASPGPAVFVAINGGAAMGVKNTAMTLLGNSIGLGTMALISALGLGAFVLDSEILTNVVKVLGALWLSYMGVKMILAVPPDANAMQPGQTANLNWKGTKLTRFRDGLILALTNPKPIIFFTSIYPQFIIVNGRENQQFMLLGITFVGLSFALLNAYSVLSSITIGKVLNARRIRIFNWVFGMFFVLLAVFLLAPIVMDA